MMMMMITMMKNMTRKRVEKNSYSNIWYSNSFVVYSFLF